MSVAAIVNAGGHEEACKDFAVILRESLGDKSWLRLHKDIRTRFISKVGTGELAFRGVMQWVVCSPIAAIIARLLRPISVLPDANCRNVEFDFNIYQKAGHIYKQRRYFFGDRPFTFVSRFADIPRLHEEFAKGLGMYLKLREESGALIFVDDGYFLKLGSLRLPLPRWISIGRFELLHTNIGKDEFQVIIRISHFLFGTLFYQRGVFVRGDA